MTLLWLIPPQAIPLFSAAPKPAKAIGPPDVSMAQHYIRSIDERSYVCIVCIYIYTHACMRSCMYHACMHLIKLKCKVVQCSVMHLFQYTCLYVPKFVRMYVRMYVCFDLCMCAMYACMYVGMFCHVMLCYVMSCYDMLCYFILCYVMLCYVMLCYVMLCYSLSLCLIVFIFMFLFMFLFMFMFMLM